VKTKLILNFEFIASHSLSIREQPHNHRWRVQAVMAGEPINGMVLNMVTVREQFSQALLPLANSHLNDNGSLSDEAQATPTCETLAAHFFRAFGDILSQQFTQHNPTVQLEAIEVELYEPNGQEWGSARLEA
jgi:6-pyruvoyl-tetrahydropterin synthase